MKDITLSRNGLVYAIDVVATLGMLERQSEVVALLRAAEMHQPLRPEDLVTKSGPLIDRPLKLAENAVARLQDAGLLADGMLTDIGRQALSAGEVPRMEEGRFRIYYFDDALWTEPQVLAIGRMKELRQHDEFLRHQAQAGVRQTVSTPAWLTDLQGGLVSAIGGQKFYLKRVDSDAVKVPENAGRMTIQAEPTIGPWIVGIEASLITTLVEQPASEHVNVQVRHVPRASMRDVVAALSYGNWSEAHGALKLAFSDAPDAVRRSLVKDIQATDLTIDGAGQFSAAVAKQVPVVPTTVSDATSWAEWRLLDKIRDPVAPHQYPRLVEQAVADLKGHPPSIRSQPELASPAPGAVRSHKQWLLQAPLDLPLEVA